MLQFYERAFIILKIEAVQTIGGVLQRRGCLCSYPVVMLPRGGGSVGEKVHHRRRLECWRWRVWPDGQHPLADSIERGPGRRDPRPKRLLDVFPVGPCGFGGVGEQLADFNDS